MNEIIKELAEDAARAMQEEMDWEILCRLLKEIGWTEVKLNWTDMTESYAHRVKEWCRSNMQGEYKGRGRTWVFESGKDATLFVLRWS